MIQRYLNADDIWINLNIFSNIFLIISVWIGGFESRKIKASHPKTRTRKRMRAEKQSPWEDKGGEEWLPYFVSQNLRKYSNTHKTLVIDQSRVKHEEETGKPPRYKYRIRLLFILAE
jgi:hypothetical protein